MGPPFGGRYRHFFRDAFLAALAFFESAGVLARGVGTERKIFHLSIQPVLLSVGTRETVFFRSQGSPCFRFITIC